MLLFVFQILFHNFTPENINLFSGIYRYENNWLRRVSVPKCHNKGLRNMEPLTFLAMSGQ